ncbi:hypothetical protein TNCV_206281 [Trichonephila clavipes]|nr:hypothetical protein TNCV_206281 [Trichonephila clavipes]
MSQRVEDLEKKFIASGNATSDSKFVTAATVHVSSSAVHLTASPVLVKLSTYDGKTKWEVVDLSNSVIPVRMANISDKTRTIQEGEVIAACALATCVVLPSNRIARKIPSV